MPHHEKMGPLVLDVKRVERGHLLHLLSVGVANHAQTKLGPARSISAFKPIQTIILSQLRYCVLKMPN